MGGQLVNPTYRDVCRGDSGHAEVVMLSFMPQQLSYTQLLTIFWQIHDPTTLNRQGPDIGTQYRSVIFYHDQHQREMAVAMKSELNASEHFSRPIVTEISPADVYYQAESYHQQYLRKQGKNSCY